MASAGKRPADVLLHEAGVAKTTEEARGLIMAGRVLACDPHGREFRIEKAGDRLDPRCTFRLTRKREGDFASRAGVKLEHALVAFGVDPSGEVILDVGIGSGGFSDCLLRRGARRIFGVDVGYGQVDWRVRMDPRVTLFERTNIRHLRREMLDEAPTLAVVDTSFISLTTVLPTLAALVPELLRIIALVKPQFECSPRDMTRGVVMDPTKREAATRSVALCAEQLGFGPLGLVESPIRGADGNIEFLMLLGRMVRATPSDDGRTPPTE